MIAAIGLGLVALGIISAFLVLAPVRMSIDRRATLLGLSALALPGLLIWGNYSGRAPVSVANLVCAVPFALGLGLLFRWRMKSILAETRATFLALKERGELKGFPAAFARVYFEID